MSSFNIYDHASQKQIDQFKPTYIYVKRHSVTGKLYFGKTNRDFRKMLSYKGSGTYWKNHVAKHGPKFVETIWVSYFTDIHDLVNYSLWFSYYFDIVKDNNWANQIIETGVGGGVSGINKGRKHSTETKEKMSASHKGKTCGKRSEEFCIKNSFAMLGKKHSEETKKKFSIARKGRKLKPHSLEAKEKMSKMAKNRHVIYVCRLFDGKILDIGNYTKWIKEMS
jgi:hypothetical protein